MIVWMASTFNNKENNDCPGIKRTIRGLLF